MKPVLVTKIAKDTIEILTDYQSNLVSVSQGTMSSGSQRSSEEGLLGSIWTIVDLAESVSVITLLVRHYKGEGGECEYTFRI